MPLSIEVPLSLEAAEIQLLIVADQGPPGIGGTRVVLGEELTGAINNSNATFFTEFDFAPGRVVVRVNGLSQRMITDYNTTGTTTIIFNESPQVGDYVAADYERA